MEHSAISSGIDRRLQVRAYRAWLEAAGEASLPRLAAALGQMAEFAPHAFVIDLADLHDPVFSHVGDALLFDCDARPATISQVAPLSLLSRLADHYLQAVACQAPVGFEADFTNRRGQPLRYRGILLPLSDDGATISHVMGLTSWKDDDGSASEMPPPPTTTLTLTTPIAPSPPPPPATAPAPSAARRAPHYAALGLHLADGHGAMTRRRGVRIDLALAIEGVCAAMIASRDGRQIVATVGFQAISPTLDSAALARAGTAMMAAGDSLSGALGDAIPADDILVSRSGHALMLHPLGADYLVWLALDRRGLNLAAIRARLDRILPDLLP